jgi:hypothetical protein
MQMGDQLRTPAVLSPEKEHLVCTRWKAAWVPENICALWRREKSLSLLETALISQSLSL